jgi:DNA-binding GntR family transcriptional regulator
MVGSANKVIKVPATLASVAYEQLRRDVMTAQFLPGQKLNIRQLCQRYDMGLSPVREALNRLLRDGLVTQTDQQGFRVASVSVEQLDELTRTRCWLNELALRQSIAHGDAAWEEGVVLAAHRLLRLPRDPLSGGSPLRNLDWEEAHRAFHASLLAACRSQWLLAFCEQLFDAAERYRHISRISRQSQRRRDEHRQIMEASVARDVELAVKLLTAHFAATAERARNKLGTLECEQLAGKDTASARKRVARST